MIRPMTLAALFALSGCIAIPAATTAPRAPAPAPMPAPNPAPASVINGVPVTLSDGSRGLALWCDAPGACIADARTACNNRQSIRSPADIDRSSARASEFFARAETEPATLVVACS